MLDLRLAVTGGRPVYSDSPVKTRCVNPAHNDPTASLAVYATNIHCFGCGFHRNDPDECLALLLGVKQAEVSEIRVQFESGTYQAKPKQPPKPVPPSLADVYHDMLYGMRRNRLAWLYDRGLTDATLREFKLGHDGFRFSIPVFDSGGCLVTIRFRRDDAFLPERVEQNGQVFTYPKYSGLKGWNDVYLVPEQKFSQVRDWIVLTESELCAIRLWQDGVPAVSATNGAGNCYLVPEMLRERYPRIRKLYVATDQDEAGDNAYTGYFTDKGKWKPGIVEMAQKVGTETIRLRWDGAKDVTEYLQEGGNLFDRLKKQHDRLKGLRHRTYVATYP